MALHQRISDWLQPYLSGQLQSTSQLPQDQVQLLEYALIIGLETLSNFRLSHRPTRTSFESIVLVASV